MLQFGLSEQVLHQIIACAQQFPEVEQLLLYGSRAKGNYKNYSDIDLAVVAPTLSITDFARVWDALNHLPLIFNLDIVHLDTLHNQVLKQKILAEGVPLFTRP